MTPTIYARAETIIDDCFNRITSLGFSHEEKEQIKESQRRMIKELERKRLSERIREEEFV